VSDDLVTEEMVGDAFCAWHGARGTDAERIDAALRAVAPLIAERASAGAQHVRASAVRRADEHARADERERCAKIAEKAEPIVASRGTTTDRNLTRLMAHKIANAIRARGA
jgi:hypothetical protein